MKLFLTFLIISSSFSLHAQVLNSTQKFWKNLAKHCGKSYEGTITAGGRDGDGFSGQKLVMRILSCNDSQIKIPFFVGDNKSRTWIITQKEQQLELKHDHRHEDGTDDKITMYGGTATNSGSDTLQVFPADQFTCNMIGYACGNVWWITLTETQYTYNLRRIGSDRVFTVTFDLTKPVESSDEPWGWKE